MALQSAIKNCYESDIFYVSDINAKRIQKTNFLVWTGHPYSVPNNLNNDITTATPSTTSQPLTIDNQVFDVMEKKSKQ